MRLSIKLILLLYVISTSFIWAQAPLKIYCIDVNTGSSTLIISPTNEYVLIDAGMTNYGASTVYPFLQNLGITHLDYTIATHYHEDHIGGMDEVIYALSSFGSNDSILNWCYDRGDSTPPSNNIYTGYASAAGSKRRVIGLDETLNLGGGAFMFCIARNGTVMNGMSVTPSTGENYRSCAFILVYNNFRFYVGGDLTGNPVSGDPDVESKAARVTGDVNVYVANHHGGRNSSITVFLDSLRPEAAIFSQGTIPSNNNHPHQEAIDRLVAHNTYMYQMNDNPTGGVIPTGHGRILNTTASINVNNTYYTINGDTYQIYGFNGDAGCLSILEPHDTITEGSIITPQALVKNYGTSAMSFIVRFKIGEAYNHIKTIIGLVPNDTIIITFDTAWYATRGNYIVTCSTEVQGDVNTNNDRQVGNLTVAFYDNEVSEILSPSQGQILFYGDTIRPKAIVKDNSEYSNPAQVKIYCLIHNNQVIYLDSLTRIYNPGITDTINFPAMSITPVSEGVYQCSVWVVRNNDLMPSNDYKTVQFIIHDPNGIEWNESSPSLVNNQDFRLVTLKLYNISGRLINTQIFYRSVDNILKQPRHWFKNLASGIYFLHITAIPSDHNSAPFTQTKKIVILPNN
jgi:beta-lactamase superfamily II metal-dependent hydrolase